MEAILTAVQGLSVLALLCNFAGNSIVIIVIWKVKSMNTSANSMLSSLAANDLEFGLVTFSEIVLYFLMDKVDGVTTKELSFDVLLRTFISVFTLAAIAVERYYAVLKPFVHRARMSKKLINKVIRCIWIAALVFSLPVIFVEHFRNIYVFGSLLICIAVTGIIKTTCYGQIVYRIWFKIHERETTNAGVLKSRKKLTKLLVTVTLVFFVCWTPLLGRNFEFQSPPQEAFYTMFSGLLALIGTAINPVLYSLHSVRFRQAVRELFSKLRCSKGRSIRDIHQLETQLQTTGL